MHTFQQLQSLELQSLGQEEYKRRVFCSGLVLAQGDDTSSHDHGILLKKALQEPIWRYHIIKWCYQVTNFLRADREIVCVAIDILDRYLAKLSMQNKHSQISSNKREYQIAVMSSLLLSIELNGPNTNAITVNDLARSSGFHITSQELILRTQDISKTLALKSATEPPTSTAFVRALIQMLPYSFDIKADLFKDAVNQIQLSIFDEFLMNNLPSSFIAWMVLENTLCNHKMMTISKEMEEFRETISSLTGQRHNICVRQRLQSLQPCDQLGPAGDSITHIIPPDTPTCTGLSTTLVQDDCIQRSDQDDDDDVKIWSSGS